MEKVKVINKGGYPLPSYETQGAVGLDVYADISEPLTLGPLERSLVPTGLFVEIPSGYEIQIRPRSGMAAKYGLSVLNSPGTIDPDYRGQIKVILVNLSNQAYTVTPGERVAQAVFARYERLSWQEVSSLDTTARGQGGFGSTGEK